MGINRSEQATSSRISEKQVKAMARCLTCYTRQAILRELGAGEKVPLAQLRRNLSVGPATLSHHVEQLQRAGLIDIERVGRSAFVRLRKDVLKSFGGWLVDLAS